MQYIGTSVKSENILIRQRIFVITVVKHLSTQYNVSIVYHCFVLHVIAKLSQGVFCKIDTQSHNY